MKIELSVVSLLLSAFAGGAALADTSSGGSASSCEVTCAASSCSVSCDQPGASAACNCNGALAVCSCDVAALASHAGAVEASPAQALNLSKLIAQLGVSRARESGRIADLAREVLHAANAQDAARYDAAANDLLAAVNTSSAPALVDYLNAIALLPMPSECGPAELDVNVGIDGQVDSKVGCSTIGGGGSASLAVLAGLILVFRRRHARAMDRA